MRLTEARIKNFEGIEEWTLKFQPGFNILKGDNGSGKTSVLDALALGLGVFAGWNNHNNSPEFTCDNVRLEYQRQGDGSTAKKYLLPSEVALTADISAISDVKQTLPWTRYNPFSPDERGSPGLLDSDEIVKLAKVVTNDLLRSLPVICYQCVPVDRMDSTVDYMSDMLFFQSDFITQTIQLIKASGAVSRNAVQQEGRMGGYRNALSKYSDKHMLLEWCNLMERVQMQKGREISEYEAVKRAAASFMEVMEPGKEYRVFYDNQLSEIVCEEKNGRTLPVNIFRAGYQSLIWMVLDIARRMAQLNAFLLDSIAQTPGVVLIDELDLHLHPKWQWRVIDALRKTFPNVQFIASTHAPILFASANDVWIVHLDGKEPQYAWSRYGLDIGTAVTEYQGAYDLPERVREIAGEVSDAINAENFPEAKKKLEELEREVAPKPGENGGSVSLADPPVLTELRARYDIESSWPEE